MKEQLVLSPAVKEMVGLVSKRTGQEVDDNAKAMLSRLEEGRAISVLDQLLRSSSPVRNCSAFIKHLITKVRSTRMEKLVVQMVSEWSDNDLEKLACEFEKSPLSGPQCSAPKDPGSLGGTISWGGAPITPDPPAGQKRKAEVGSVLHERSVRAKPAHKSIARRLELTPAGEKWQAFGKLPFVKRQLILKYFHPDAVMLRLAIENFRMFLSTSLPDMEAWLRSCSGNTTAELTFSHDASDVKAPHMGYTCKLDKRAQIISMGLHRESEGTPLQRAFHDDNVLRVSFTADKAELEKNESILRRLQTEGLQIALRTYYLYTFKDEKQRKRKKSADLEMKYFFLCIQSTAEADACFQQYDSIQDAREYLGHFRTVKILSKCLARMRLGVSKTVQGLTSADLANVNVVEIADFQCKDANNKPSKGPNGENLIATDGIGCISEDLLRKCPTSIYRGKKIFDSGRKEEYPLVIQVRLFYRGSIYKGLLLLNKKLPLNTLQVRLSMRKVERDPAISSPTFDSLEICGTSREPKLARVSRQLILLLVYGGVSEDAILTFAQERLQDLTTCLKDFKTAVRVLSSHLDERKEYEVALKMLLANLDVTEPFVKRTLTELCNAQLTDLSKGRIPVARTFYLKGCADPTGLIKRDEVVILLENGVLNFEGLDNGAIVAERVLVYKPPGLHPGDIHLFKAIHPPPGLMAYVGSARYGIFFSVQGERSVVDEIASADLDGDEFWICLNHEIIKGYFRFSSPWQVPKAKPTAVKPIKASPDVELFEREHFQMCLDAAIRPSCTTGVAANAWLAHMDKLMHARTDAGSLLDKCLRLVDVYYAALDADKTGLRPPAVTGPLNPKEYPHFMEMAKKPSYVSQSVLGRIYDMVKDPSSSGWIPPEADIEHDERFILPGHEDYLKPWHERLCKYNQDVARACDEHAQDNYLRNLKCEELLMGCRQMLYGGQDFVHRTRDVDQIKLEASAIYVLVYNKAQRQQDTGKEIRVRIAWKLAGDALLEIIKEDDWLNVHPAAYRKAFGRSGGQSRTDEPVGN